MDFDDYIKDCESCNAHVPLKAKVCDYCGFEFVSKILTDEELKVPFEEIIENINNAFFRLESFMAGTITNYKYFAFKSNFDLFFAKAKLSENFTPMTRSLIDDYWHLTEQLRVDLDKGNYENNDVYENEGFCDDINEIMKINDSSWRFIEFSTEEELANYQKKFSVVDIIGKINSNSFTHKETSGDIFQKAVALFSIFDSYRFNLDTIGGISVNLNDHSLNLYNEVSELKLSIKHHYLSSDSNKFELFCNKLIEELKRINEGLNMPFEFGIKLDFQSNIHTVEPEDFKAYIDINKRYLNEVIDFVSVYVKPGKTIELDILRDGHPDTKVNQVLPDKNQLKGFDSIFISGDWRKYISAFENTAPPLLSKEWVFIGNRKKHIGVICGWIYELKLKGIIKQSCNRKELASILNNELKDFNMGADGKTFDNPSNEYTNKFKSQLIGITK